MIWLDLYKHLIEKTELIIVSDCDHYRKMAYDLPKPTDSVLEIGCSSGLATAQLAKSASQVFAIDNSAEFIEKACEQSSTLGNVSFTHLDGRDIESIRALVSNPDLIFIDVGGDSFVTRVIPILRSCLFAYLPRQIIIRNFELSIIHSLISENHLPPESRRVRSVLGISDINVESLLDLSHSKSSSDRLFAVRKLRNVKSAEVQARLQTMTKDTNPKIQRICSDAISNS